MPEKVSRDDTLQKVGRTGPARRGLMVLSVGRGSALLSPTMQVAQRDCDPALTAGSRVDGRAILPADEIG